MPNLTQHLRVVGTEVAGIQPQIGCYVVLLKQSNGGRILHRVLQPGERADVGGFKRLFQGTSDFISIPVTSSQTLRHEFTSAVDHVSPGHAIEIDYVLSFAVSSPEKVAIGWSDDPVRKVEDEIKRVLDSAPRKEGWTELREHILRDRAAGLFRDTVRDELPELSAFAADYGLEIKSLKMTVSLSRTDAKPDIEQAELDRTKRLIDIETSKRVAEKIGDHEVNKLGAYQEAELEAIKTPQKLRKSAVDAAGIAFETVARNTQRVEDLVRAAHELRSLSGNMEMPALGSGSSERLALGPAGQSDNQLTLVMGELVFAVETMSGDQDRKRELLSSLLHLLAEACRGKAASDEIVDRYSKMAKDLIASDWSGGLSASQFKTLNQFSNFEILRDRLR